MERVCSRGKTVLFCLAGWGSLPCFGVERQSAAACCHAAALFRALICRSFWFLILLGAHVELELG